MKQNIYESNVPYPEIKVLKQNKYYASLLKEDYAGFVSELTAITQYLYHSFEINGLNEEISYMLEKISIVEMKHLEILAQLIKLLGEKPIYNSEQYCWSANYVYYGYSIIDQLNKNLESEYQAINNYKKHIMMIDDPYIQAILQRIILDEEIHINLFNQAIKSLM